MVSPRSLDGANKLHLISSWENRKVSSGSLWSDSRVNVLDFGPHSQSPSASFSLSECLLGNMEFDKASGRVILLTYKILGLHNKQKKKNPFISLLRGYWTCHDYFVTLRSKRKWKFTFFNKTILWINTSKWAKIFF